jgi:hypothetical protein
VATRSAKKMRVECDDDTNNPPLGLSRLGNACTVDWEGESISALGHRTICRELPHDYGTLSTLDAFGEEPQL